MITRICSTKAEVVSWWSSSDGKWICAGTCSRFSQIEVVQIQSKLTNLRIQRRYRICTRPWSWVCWWICWVLNVCTIIVQGWTTFRDQECAAHSKTCRTVPINCPAFGNTFGPGIACTQYFLRWWRRGSGTLTIKNMFLVSYNVKYQVPRKIGKRLPDLFRKSI